jgi:hypothetical protein
MRLKRLERGHGLRQKLQLAAFRLMSGKRPHDLMRTLLYRPEFLGKPIKQWHAAVKHGALDWSQGERELFAAFTSKLNQCVF